MENKYSLLKKSGLEDVIQVCANSGHLVSTPNQTDLLTKAWAVPHSHREADKPSLQGLRICKAWLSAGTISPEKGRKELSCPVTYPKLLLLRMRERKGKGEIRIPWLMDVQRSTVKVSHLYLCLPNQFSASIPPWHTQQVKFTHMHTKAQFMVR